MHPPYNTRAAKKPANLSVNGDLLDKARELEINLSATLEHALADAVRSKQRAQWLADNKAAIEIYNQHVDKHGVFSDGMRSF